MITFSYNLDLFGGDWNIRCAYNGYSSLIHHLCQMSFSFTQGTVYLNLVLTREAGENNPLMPEDEEVGTTLNHIHKPQMITGTISH